MNSTPAPEIERVGGKVYFPGLDGLRAYAAISVLIFHAFENPNRWFHMPEVKRPLLFLSGGDAVSLFFVLSGFLITYLLLEEKKQTGDVSLRRFYRKRVGRIFPLYYLVLLLGLVVIPVLAHDYPRSTLSPAYAGMMLTFFSNLAFAMGAGTLTVGHLWSIGVEEQFYFVWPVLLRWFKRPWVAIVGVIVLWVAATGAVLLAIGSHGKSPALRTVLRFLYFTRFECMALGAATAYILHLRHGFQAVILHIRSLGLAFVIGFLAMTVWRPRTEAQLLLRDFVFSMAFSIIVAQVATGRFRALLDTAPLRFLGRISYGLYMYHPLVIGVLVPLMLPSAPEKPSAGVWWVYVSSVVLATIGVAAASYYSVESPILRWAGSSRGVIDSRAEPGRA